MGRRGGDPGDGDLHRLDLVLGHPRPGLVLGHQGGPRGRRRHPGKEATYHGVRFATIHPGFTDTPMVRALGQEYIEKNILPYTQLKRLIDPAEIADAIYFMICNSAVSGELWADAGWHPSA